MDTNDLNRRIRYAFMLDDNRVLDLLSQSLYQANLEQVTGWRQKEGADGFIKCPAASIDALLNSLIADRRGPKPDSTAEKAGSNNNQPSPSNGADSAIHAIDNNKVLKQLRIALGLRTDEVHQTILNGGGKLGKSEVNALFRNPSARNFRRCGDQVLRWFLAGLSAGREALEK